MTVCFDSYKEPNDIRIETPGFTIGIHGGQCSGRVELYVTAPPEKVKRHELSGTVIGLPIHELFESEYDAKDRKSLLESKLTREEDSTLAIKDVMVDAD